MTYQQTLDYLFSRLPMFTRVGAAAFKKDLTNTLALCELLGNPERKLKCIHIAGTNGKGSTSHMLASVLQEAGYKTGLYTSPHLKDFRERIRVNGSMIGEYEVTAFVEKYKADFERIEPSFFEWSVALCFDHFACMQTDVCVIETGLGGRLDSTNVISPLLSVITNIGWDHTDMLGDSLEKIAFEKAGIIKAGVPVVIGETQPDTMPVFKEKAAAENSPITFADNDCSLTNLTPLPEGLTCDLHGAGTDLREIYCDLGGIYQQHNLKTVLASIIQLRKQGFFISDEQIRKGLARVKTNTSLMGRWQVLAKEPLTVCDTGHNINGISYVLKQIAMQDFKQLHFVIGMVRDKDIGSILSVLPKNAVYYFCNADIPRALPAADLAMQAAAAGLTGSVNNSVEDALSAARQQAAKDDLIFIGGSTFVVAEVV